jgi:hypothetical protein
MNNLLIIIATILISGSFLFAIGAYITKPLRIKKNKSLKWDNKPLVDPKEVRNVSPEEFAARLLEKYAQDKYKPSNKKK